MFMGKKIPMIGFLLLIILLSGCTENTDDGNSGNTSDDASLIPDATLTPTPFPSNYSLDSMVNVEPLPNGYEILGILPISDYDEYSENIVDTREGAYRDPENVDVFLDIIELNSEQAAFDFISNYKAQYVPLDVENRFTTISFNEHSAERIIEYKYSSGDQIPKYKIIWNQGNIVFVVRSNSHLESSSFELAKATGY
ncbi:MAG: hypothetical protein MIO93_01850 [ANME-2 cluster archaeon]|nr:hypothetical protein [ANME-2 cluster archaeon]